MEDHNQGGAPAAQRGRTTLIVIFARRHNARRGEDGPATGAGTATRGALRRVAGLAAGAGVTAVRAAARAGALSRERQRAKLPRPLRRDSPPPRPPTARHTPDRSTHPLCAGRAHSRGWSGPDGLARRRRALEAAESCHRSRPHALAAVVEFDNSRVRRSLHSA